RERRDYWSTLAKSFFSETAWEEKGLCIETTGNRRYAIHPGFFVADKSLDLALLKADVPGRPKPILFGGYATANEGARFQVYHSNPDCDRYLGDMGKKEEGDRKVYATTFPAEIWNGGAPTQDSHGRFTGLGSLPSAENAKLRLIHPEEVIRMIDYAQKLIQDSIARVPPNI
ncbi:MAG TPA: hypothetical protein VJB12_05245, partial [Candidatus Nanoarchaeia archaeon]|nr:hypothetical protein [Candidatus Nanoarchaeia archaeon]